MHKFGEVDQRATSTAEPTELLIEEERRETRRRRLRNGALAVLLIGAGFGVMAGFGAPPFGQARSPAPTASPRDHPALVATLATRVLSPQDLYSSLDDARGRLFLVGPDPLIAPGSALTLLQKSAPACHSAVVDPATLALTQLRSASCEDPALYGETVLPVNRIVNGGPQLSTVQIARVANNRAGFSLGPVVMTYQEASDTDAVWAYGGGYLWIYDPTTTKGPELLQISETTGAVIDSARMPDISRPLLAANDVGLWLAPASNSLGNSPRGVYLYRPGRHAATLVASIDSSSSRGFASWLAATATEAYAAVPANRAGTVSLWGFGAAGSRQSNLTLPFANGLDYGEFGYGAANYAASNGEVLTVAPGPGSRGVNSEPQEVFVLNPSSGRSSRIATARPPATYASSFAQPAVVMTRGALFFLDPPMRPNGTPNGFSALYRVDMSRGSRSQVAA